ncbi:hypothetical protein [Burkholderia ubonensis]|uniref:hypothetical protein n=1 Tax=Burkholderia ubonensis TaxID=101571 RepID=UPI000AF643E4|nr:hypothetical protein [Burkholderia ubonensis]
MSLREWFFRRAMARAVAKRAPSRIPLTGERLLQRDYFSATLSGLAEGDVLVDSMSGNDVVGRAWVPPADPDKYGEYATPVTIPIDRAARSEVEYTYYLRQHEFREHKSTTLWWRLLVGYYHRNAWMEEFRQGRYNRQALERRRRMDLLQWLIEHAVTRSPGEERAFHSPLDILKPPGDARWARHPAAREQLDYARLLLESLLHDQLVESDGLAGFRAAPAAIGVAEVYVTEERRHADSERTQRRLLWVAIAAGFAAAVQALAAIWPLASPERAVASVAVPPTSTVPVQPGRPPGSGQK